MDAKEEVRARLNIEDVIGEYVQLKRAGRNFRGLSPFSNERTPSFYVSPDKGIWHDFSGGKGGDVFSFVMEVEGLDFRQTLELLARKAGVDLSLYEKAGTHSNAQQKERLLKLLDLAATFYQHSLVKNKHALDYVLKTRGLSREVAQKFRLGYSPKSFDGLLKFLIKRGFSEADIKAAGLVAQRRGGMGDMFRGRMMVPLSDNQGQIVGFTARMIEDEPGAPKYINTPQTLLYDKGRQIFGLAQAKEAIRKADKAVVVEGNLDVISSHQAGVENVVAAAGTALTENHIKSLTRLSPHIALAFDADAAGLAATERSIALAQIAGAELTIINLPGEAKDPDDLIKQDPKLWQQAIGQSQPVVDWALERYKTLYDVTTASGKKQLSSRSLAIIKMLKDPIEQEHYVQILAKLTGASEAALKTKLAQENQQTAKPFKAVAETAKSPAEEQLNIKQDSLLALSLVDPDVRDPLRHLKPEDVTGEARQAVLNFVNNNSQQAITDEIPLSLRKHDIYVKILLLQAETRYGEWNGQDRYAEATKLVKQLQRAKVKQQKEKLIESLRTAESNGDEETAQQLRTDLNKLIKEE